MAGCSKAATPVPAEPTAVIPTEETDPASSGTPPTAVAAVPSPTPTEVPTATPTEVPTPTATPELTVWEIAEQMLAECAGARPLPFDTPIQVDSAYQDQLEARVIQDHPELGGIDFFLQTRLFVLANDGVNAGPFAWIDLAEETPLTPEMKICEGYVLALEYLNAENFDRDGVLAGEAYLFYEVGGTQPNVLDGELREVRFVFPPVP